METILFYLALITLVSYLAFSLELLIGNRTIKFLKDTARFVSINPPRVSVIIPARNEAHTIANALQSVLRQNYENLEILVINDRSTDTTRLVLETLSRQYPQLQVVNLTELPVQWLGKNHALHYGARQATGQLLLFTDADVVMHPDAISRAVNYLLENRLDHVTALPDQTTPSTPLKIFLATFAVLFSFYARPWRVRRPNRWHIGIGAFQLIRAELYHRIGGHLPIALRPDDDMKLGKLLKQNGARQEMVWGQGLMSVTWYFSLRELIQGLMKNAYAGINYSFLLLLASTLSLLLFNVFPFAAIFLTTGATRWMYCAVLAIVLLIFIEGARYMRQSYWYGFGFPIATLLCIYILWKAALKAIFTGTIDWRGTKYSLNELRQNKI